MNATVRRGAECDTDHQLLCMKFTILGRGPLCKSSSTVARILCYNASKIVKHNDMDTEEAAPCREARQELQKQVRDRASTTWPLSGTAEEMWTALRTALIESADLVLGTEKWKEPDCLQEKASTLEPILKLCNELHTKWLGSGCKEDHQKFAKCCREAR